MGYAEHVGGAWPHRLHHVEHRVAVRGALFANVVSVIILIAETIMQRR